RLRHHTAQRPALRSSVLARAKPARISGTACRASQQSRPAGRTLTAIASFTRLTTPSPAPRTLGSSPAATNLPGDRPLKPEFDPSGTARGPTDSAGHRAQAQHPPLLGRSRRPRQASRANADRARSPRATGRRPSVWLAGDTARGLLAPPAPVPPPL